MRNTERHGTGADRLPGETRLFYRLAGRSSGEFADLPELEQSVDWQALFRLAERERGLPILRRLLARRELTAMPAPEVEQLRALAMVSEFRMGYLAERLAQLLAALDAEGIRVILLKGAALACTVYPSFRERPMEDLDLLVEPEHAQAAWRAAVELGWVPALPGGFEPFYGDHQHLCPLNDGQSTGLGLELHTRLFPTRNPFALTIEELWTDARELRLGAVRTYVPSVPHAALHLCVHFAWSHSMGSAAWRTFRDLCALHGADALAWDPLVQLARSTRAATCCYWTLRLARTLSTLPVPDDVLRSLKPPMPAAILSRLEAYYISRLGRLSGLNDAPVRLVRALWAAGIMPHWSGHGRCRPWDRSEAFIAVGTRAILGDGRRPSPVPRRRPRWGPLWRTLRVLLPHS